MCVPVRPLRVQVTSSGVVGALGWTHPDKGGVLQVWEVTDDMFTSAEENTEYVLVTMHGMA